MNFKKNRRHVPNSKWEELVAEFDRMEGNSQANKRHSSSSPLLTLVRIIATVLSITVVLGGLGAFMWLYELGIFDDQTHKLAMIRDWKIADNTVVFDKDGTPIAELFDKYSRRVALRDAPPLLIDSILAVEDRKFWRHSGIDLAAMARVAVQFVLQQGEFSQGGSTITQQLVRNFLLTRDKTIARKIQEIALAMQLEKMMTKEQILELYINVLYLGNGAFGVGAAAERYFGKTLNGLEPQELILIAGLFQSPSRYDPAKFPDRAKRRQRHVIDSLIAVGQIKRDEGAKIAKAELHYQPYQSQYGRNAPYYIDFITQEASELLGVSPEVIKGEGLRIYTNLDQGIQSHAEQAVKRSEVVIKALEKRISNQLIPRNPSGKAPRIEVAAVVVDHVTNQIVGMVGGRNYQFSQFNRAATARRSPGSAFKPILYSLALQRGFKWSDMLYVSPVHLGDYRPKSTESDYLTETTLLRSFYRSINAPALELATRIGTPAIIEHAKKMGIESPLHDEYGVVLGGSAASLLDMARVYGVFARGGKAAKIGAISKIEDGRGKVIFEKSGGQNIAPSAEDMQVVLDSKVNHLMKEGLRDVFKFGTAHAYSELGEFAAGKTGTSNNSKDNWFCGFDARHVLIVWIGSDNYLPVDNGENGATLALPLWADIMTKIGERKAEKYWNPPPGVVSRIVHSHYGTLSPSGVQMWFLEDNLPSEKSNGLELVKKDNGYRGIFNR
jgi:membrane peptidoglycan carboxypeptidase